MSDYTLLSLNGSRVQTVTKKNVFKIIKKKLYMSDYIIKISVLLDVVCYTIPILFTKIFSQVLAVILNFPFNKQKNKK